MLALTEVIALSAKLKSLANKQNHPWQAKGDKWFVNTHDRYFVFGAESYIRFAFESDLEQPLKPLGGSRDFSSHSDELGEVSSANQAEQETPINNLCDDHGCHHQLPIT